MAALSLYLSIIVLLVSTAATALCFAYYGLYRHRAAFWLSLCMAGLGWFAVTVLVSQLSKLITSSLLGPIGLRLLWQAFGGILVTLALPRFLLTVFGVRPRAIVSLSLYAATVIVAALSGMRVAAGWDALPTAAALPNVLLRVVLYTIIGGGLLSPLIFQSRLPDRSLYRTIIIQIGAMAVLLPFVFLEDSGVFAVPGFPYLSAQVLLLATSVSVTLHARRSLKRPKYVANDAPSTFFVQRFGISDRELDVVTEVLNGLGNNEIGEKLFISPRTVEKHLYNVYQKAGIRNRVQLLNLLRSDSM